MANITYTDRTNATTPTGATTEAPAAIYNELKAWNNSPQNSLGAFNPAITFDSQGQYNDYTLSSVQTLSASSIVDGNFRSVKVTTAGGIKIFIGSGISNVIGVDLDNDNDFTLAAGTYWFYMASIGGSVHLSVPEATEVPDVDPQILALTISDDNTYADVSFNKGIYGANDGSTPAALADFSIVFAANGGTATNWTASSAKQNDSATEGSASLLAGGETTIRIFGSLTGTADGQETLTVSPTDGSSLYDSAGQAMDAGESAVDNLNIESIIIMQDNFAGTVIDVGKWNITDPADDVAISQNNELIFTNSGTGTVPSTTTNRADSVNTFSDGVIQADLSGDASADSVTVFQMRNAGNTNYVQMFGTSVATCRIVIGGSTEYDFVSAISIFNTFKIVNVANSITFQYWSGAAWTTIGTTQSFDAGSGLFASMSQNKQASGANPTREFNNFYLSSEDYITNFPV